MALIKILLVILVLFGMVMLLLGINHLFTHDHTLYDDSESEIMRRNLKSDRGVIPPESLFARFLAKSIPDRRRESRHKKASP